MTIQEAISRVKKDIGVSTDDSYISSRYVYAILKSVRSELLRQEIEKKGIWDNFPAQSISKFSLCSIDIAESKEFTVGIKLLKSKLVLPDIMDTKDGKVLNGIYLQNGKRLDVISYTTWTSRKNRRFKTTEPIAFIRKKRLYVADYDEAVDELYVDIDAVFENPEEVEALNSTCDENNCIYYPSLNFQVPGYLESRLFRIAKEDVRWSFVVPKDVINNGKEENPNVDKT